MTGPVRPARELGAIAERMKRVSCTRPVALLCAFITLASGACAASDSKHDAEIAAAREAARRDSDSSRQWLGPEQMSAAIAKPMQVCRAKVSEDGRGRFTAYLSLRRSGAVSRVLVDPESRLALCFGEQIKAATFSGVPKDGVWIEVVMEPRRK